MRCVTTLSLILALSGICTAQGDDSRDREAKAIERGLAFLAKDAVAWKTTHNCVSCHHAGMVVWAMREAKQRSFAVDEAVLADMTQWMHPGDGRTGVPRPEGRPKALNMKAIYFALALESNPEPDEASQQAIARFLNTTRDDQLENGSWWAWPETRPPMFGGSDDSMSGLATLALVSARDVKDEMVIAARDRGVKWLTETKSDGDPQSLAVRLMVASRIKRPEADLKSLAQTIQENQQADGGWAQAGDMDSDAWATGQALYALALSGVGDEKRLSRGRAFLVSTQREDGSWPMTSRPTKPGTKGSMSLIPITGGGSGWGVLGLVRSLPEKK
jgi:hypothetical protein